MLDVEETCIYVIIQQCSLTPKQNRLRRRIRYFGYVDEMLSCPERSVGIIERAMWELM